MTNRLQAMGNPKYVNGFTPTIHPDRLEIPSTIKKPSMIFVDSMSDLFHPKIPLDFIAKVFDVMKNNPQHIFQVLTKRPARMQSFLKELYSLEKPYSNVWIGTSVENQTMAETRLPLLLDTPASLRFVSIEPLLGPVHLITKEKNFLSDYIHTFLFEDQPTYTVKQQINIDWVIAGAETGPHARICKTDWLRIIRDHCRLMQVPFFLKQINPQKHKVLDGDIWQEFPKSLK